MNNINFEKKKQRLKAIITDWIMTAIAFFFFNIYRYYHLGLDTTYFTLYDYLGSGKLILEQFLIPTILLFVYWLSGYYNSPFERSRLSELLATLYSQLFNTICIYLVLLTNDQILMRKENLMLLFILFILLFSFTYAGRLSLTRSILQKFKNKRFGYKTVIIGTAKEALNLAKELKGSSSKPGYDIVGFLKIKGDENNEIKDTVFSDIKFLNNIEELKYLCEEGRVDQVIIVPEKRDLQTKIVLDTLYQLFPYDISIRIKPDLLSYITPSIRLEDILGEPFIDITKPGTSEFSKNIKRTLDIIISSIGLLVTSPLLISLGIIIKTTTRGPMIYKQERIGYHRRPFNIYKFRSMELNAEQEGPQLSRDNDPRITPIGKWMRKFRLDELPQFFNIIKGEMSLVGPRPERSFYIEKIIQTAPWYMLVHQVRPGLTSWGMVKYGYASTVEQMIKRNRFDLIYLANMSVAVDFKILIHTVNTVATGKGK